VKNDVDNQAVMYTTECKHAHRRPKTKSLLIGEYFGNQKHLKKKNIKTTLICLWLIQSSDIRHLWLEWGSGDCYSFHEYGQDGIAKKSVGLPNSSMLLQMTGFHSFL
jgi:hypothetical protein